MKPNECMQRGLDLAAQALAHIEQGDLDLAFSKSDVAQRFISMSRELRIGNAKNRTYVDLSFKEVPVQPTPQMLVAQAQELLQRASEMEGVVFSVAVVEDDPSVVGTDVEGSSVHIDVQPDLAAGIAVSAEVGAAGFDPTMDAAQPDGGDQRW